MLTKTLGKIFTITLFQVFLLTTWLVAACNGALTESELKNYVQGTFEKEATDLCYQSNIAEFALATDVQNKTKEQIVVRKTMLLFKLF